MDSSALMLNFKRASNPACLDTSQVPSRVGDMHFATKASNILRISKPRALSFQPISREGRFMSSIISVRANTNTDFDEKRSMIEKENHLDLDTKKTSDTSPIQAQVSSNSGDMNGNAKPSSRTTTDENETLGNQLSSNSVGKPGLNASSSVISKTFGGTGKGTTSSRQIWSATAGTVPKTNFDLSSRTSTQQTLSASRQRVLDALRQAEKGGRLTKFGQPVVPSDIFDEPSESVRKASSEPFKFTLNQGQIFLAFSFLLISCLMFGTAYLVWKVGAIHYNEY